LGSSSSATSGPFRLTAGEYDLVGDPYAKLHALRVFFTVAAVRYPKVWDEFEGLAVDADATPAAIRAWAARHKLRGGSVIETTAIETALIWRTNPDLRRERIWCAATLASASGRPVVPAVDAIRPDPLNERRDDWLARAAATWDRQTALLKTVSFKPARIKTNPDHFEWLADYLVGEQTIQTIAVAAGRSWKTVSDALLDLSSFIGLEIDHQSAKS
jgi:hypothetical protein